MKKTIAQVLALILCVSLFAGFGTSRASADNTLNVYTWSEMFDPEVLAEFEEETGVTVNYTNFDYDDNGVGYGEVYPHCYFEGHDIVSALNNQLSLLRFHQLQIDQCTEDCPLKADMEILLIS